jgi:ethanolamine utilization protein EutN
MLLGRVVGRLWASRQASGLDGRKLLLIRPESTGGGETRRLVVAVDGLDAGPGDRVIVAHGTRVRDLTVGATVADKDVVIGIVDGHVADERGAGAVGGARPAKGSRP